MKRGQEEIVGFMVVVVLVALIGVGFLGFMFAHKQTNPQTSSTEVSQVMESIIGYTGNCSIGSEGYDRAIGRNIAACASDSGTTCVSGENVCDYANRSISNIMDAAYNIQNGSATKGYQFEVMYQNSSSDIMNVSEGVCSGSYKADEIPLPYSSLSGTGAVRITLKICN